MNYEVEKAYIWCTGEEASPSFPESPLHLDLSSTFWMKDVIEIKKLFSAPKCMYILKICCISYSVPMMSKSKMGNRKM